MHKKLFIPGPIDVKEDVLAKLSTPQIGHRTKEASELQKRISEKLQVVFQTNNTILLSTSSGTGLMEGAVRSCTKNRAAVFSCGAFGKKFYKICKSNAIQNDLYEVPMGEGFSVEFVSEALKKAQYDLVTFQHNETSTGVTNPIGELCEYIKANYPEIIIVVDAVSSMGGANIPVDKWGIDICITSTQKCIGLPAGMSFASVSERAIEKARTVEFRGMYFDYVELYDFVKKNNQYPSTPSLPHMFALDYQLDKIIAEGIEARFQRHLDMAKIVQDFGATYFELLVQNEKYKSETVTCIKNTRNIDISQLNKDLALRGYMISDGYGDLKGQTFRISHMGDYTTDDVNGLLDNIKDILKL